MNKYLIEVAVSLLRPLTDIEREELASSVGAVVERLLQEAEQVNSVSVWEM